MALKITKLSEVESNKKSVKAVIFGPFGIGKTSLLKTLDEPTLCLDFEAGLLSVQNWSGDALSVETWEEARDLACLICGANPAIRRDQCYSKNHYEYCLKKYAELAEKLKQYKCIFIDSITVASRLCLEFAKSQPDIINTKTGKPDVRAAYGTLATEMLIWVNQFQHLQSVDVVFVGGLDQKQDDFNRTVYSPQVEGSKIAAELPGILDEVITMVAIQGTRKFVCQTINVENYPAKDRSGKLGVLEDAHLGKLFKKIKEQNKVDEIIISKTTNSETTTNEIIDNLVVSQIMEAKQEEKPDEISAKSLEDIQRTIQQIEDQAAPGGLNNTVKASASEKVIEQLKNLSKGV